MRRNGVKLWLIVAAMAALVLGTSPAAAVDYTVSKITNNSSSDYATHLNANGEIVWVGHDGSDREIYYYDARLGGDPIQITDNSYDESFPQINDNGEIAWYGSDGNDSEIYYYRLGGSPKRLTNNIGNDYHTRINANGEIVWQGLDGSDYEIYYYDARVGGDPIQITNNSYNDYSPQINDNGEIVWYGLDSSDTEIFYYDARFGGDPVQITDNSSNDSLPQINANGEIVWRGHDGSDYEIYYYRVGWGMTKISMNNYNDLSPQINASGEIVWQGLDGSDYEIYYYDARVGGAPLNISDNSLSDYDPQINANGEIVWWVYKTYNDGEIYYYDTRAVGVPIRISDYYPRDDDDRPQINAKGDIVLEASDGSDYEIYLAIQPLYRYDFWYWNCYGSGDYYYGYVYAPADYGYSVGDVIWTQDEAGSWGQYCISGSEAGGDYGQRGKVYVTSYYDNESGNTYTPLSYGTAVGASYLASEHDYIIQSGAPEFYFGGGFYEADVVNRYDFWYWNCYGSGDYYYGYVYALADYGYSVGDVLWTQDEAGSWGYYCISGSEAAAGDYSQKGKVYVTSYYDNESGNTYTPVSYGTAVGADYLASEYDYIIQSSISQFYFGGGYYEADANIDRYDFWYWNCYGSGDYYYGYLYAPADYGYSVGYTHWTLDETGNWAFYYVCGKGEAAVDYSQKGQIYVSSYYDNESGNTYTPVGYGAAVGTNYLTSEYDYIIQAGIPAYYFGGGYYEADVGS
ncbi:MAG: hypothetical protein ACOZFS_06845 [Thermodesulfobacteriota bacterium]